MNDIYLKAALVADALSLGPHWVYNQTKLARIFPEGISKFHDPASPYHPSKKAGDLTHYGDQTLMLKSSLSSTNTFSLPQWREDWTTSMSSYQGYIDGATKETLQQSGHKPSSSNDLAGASRIAPILDLDLSLEDSILAARQQTSLTHGDPGLPDAAEFFIRAAFGMQDGVNILSAFESAAAQGHYPHLPVSQHLSSIQGLLGQDIMSTAAKLGLTCHLPEAFPLTLFFALQPNSDFLSTISQNGLAGGDTSARAMLLALLYAQSESGLIAGFYEQINTPSSTTPQTTPGSNKVQIPTPSGNLAGVLDLPEETPKAYALFAHCFTCGKDFVPEKRITQRLAKQGIASLRIDFRGLGSSDGSFSESSFLTNIEDLLLAAAWLEENFSAPQLLIGHSLGGSAVLAAASLLPHTKAIATIGAPAEPAHVKHLFEDYIPDIIRHGSTEIQLAGRNFTIGKIFLDDLERHDQMNQISKLTGIEKLILHSPSDNTVPLENAGDIYSALNHPKSFISLANSDHLLLTKGKAEYVADLISIWSSSALGIS